jgi:ABC-type transporter Mla subunit MlaD
MDDDAKARDRMYERAEEVAGALAAVGDELRDAIADVNSSAEANLGDRDTTLGKAVRVLNNQLQAKRQPGNDLDQ